MFNEDRNVKLVGFGSSVSAGSKNSEDGLVGTPYYIAPEIFEK